MTKKDKSETRNIRRERARIVDHELETIFPGKVRTPLQYNQDHELLMAVIMSAQSKDEKVNEITAELFRKYRSVKDFARADIDELSQDISKIGLYRSKANYLRESARIIQENHSGLVPENFAQLIKFPGVGRKTAHVVLGHLFNIVEGIAVDTHVIRLANKFGLTDSKDPNVVEKELMDILPKESWWDFSNRIKAYGREISPARPKNLDPISKILIEKGLLPKN